MPIIASFPKTKFNLMEVNVQNYMELDSQLKNARLKAAKEIIDTYPDGEIILAINRLASVCFDVRGETFIREGASSFLADIIKAYVEKYDGPRLFQAYNEETLDTFKFSQQSTEVFAMLATIAHGKAVQTKNKMFEEHLASNIANKVWIPIITMQFEPFTHKVAQDMQKLAANEGLLNTIFRNNLDYLTSYHLNAALENLEATAADTNNHDVITKTKVLSDLVIKLRDSNTPQPILFMAVESTNQLLNKQISPEDYQSRIQRMEGASSKGYQALAIAMWAVALAAAAAAIILATGGAAIPLIAGASAASLCLGAAGGGFFAKSKSTGLAKSMEDSANAIKISSI